jgi:hypothetical protein
MTCLPLPAGAKAAGTGRAQLFEEACDWRFAVASVSCKDFVSAFAGEDHVEFPAGVLGQQRGGQAGVVAHQFIGGPHHMRDAPQDGVAVDF